MRLIYWARDMNYEVVVGLEIHDQPLLRSKMFSSCTADYTSIPLNTYVWLGCVGMPSILFIVNRKVVKFIVMTAQAFNCPIPKYTKFGRKNHFYFDVMQGY